MIIDLVVLLALILVNGVFALSEIAIVSSRRARLMQLADAGNAGARCAIALGSNPTRFLSSVQVGITSIGILNGAIGEDSVASRLRVTFAQIPAVAPYAETLSLAIMVVLLTYFSLILGELVPKRLALTHPERVATVIARPMHLLATVGRPVVYLLSVSTDAVLRLFGIRHVTQPAVTVEEIRLMIAQGAEEGLFERGEHEMVTNVLNLDDRHVGSVLTPRSDVVFLDLRDALDVNREKLRRVPHSVLPLCEGGLDRVVGFVRSTRVINQLLDGRDLDLAALTEEPLFVPETMTVMKLLEQFKRTHLPLALVIDEYGAVEGLVTLTDVVSSIVGDLPSEPGQEPSVLRREDGSWSLDGALDIDTVLRTLAAESAFGDEDRQHYHTLGGLAMLAIGRVPRIGDVFEKGGYRFEIVDMDGNRVDRVVASRIRQQ